MNRRSFFSSIAVLVVFPKSLTTKKDVIFDARIQALLLSEISKSLTPKYGRDRVIFHNLSLVPTWKR